MEEYAVGVAGEEAMLSGHDHQDLPDNVAVWWGKQTNEL